MKMSCARSTTAHNPMKMSCARSTTVQTVNSLSDEIFDWWNIHTNEVFKLKLCLIFVNFVDVLQYQWLKQMENGKKECLCLIPTNA